MIENLLAAFQIDQIVLIVLLVLMVVVVIVLPMFTNKKRQKQVNELQNSVKIGDTVKTVGGLVGKVIEIREISPVDKEMVIETGIEGSKTTMVFDIQAVYLVMNKTAVSATDAKEQSPFDENVKIEAIAPAETMKEEAAVAAPVLTDTAIDVKDDELAAAKNPEIKTEETEEVKTASDKAEIKAEAKPAQTKPAQARTASSASAAKTKPAAKTGKTNSNNSSKK